MTEHKMRLMQGNEACVQGALDAGVRFFAGYPITPSTEIAEGMAVKLPVLGGKFMQMEDELASISAVIGASVTGTKAMTATSGPGFSLMQENIGFACCIEAPCIIVNVQRGGPSSGRPTAPAQADVMQARWGTHGDHPAITLSPSSAQETYYLTIEAVNLAEKFRTPVVLLMDEVIAHTREGVLLPDKDELKLTERPRPQGNSNDFKPFGGRLDEVPPIADFGCGYKINYTGLVHDAVGHPTGNPELTDQLLRRLVGKVAARSDEIVQYEEIMTDDADVVIVAYGCTARSAKRAVTLGRKQGLRIGLIRPITLWPFPEKAIKTISDKGIPILVPELNLGQLVLEVERVVAGRCKVTQLSRVDGELFTAAEILSAVKGVAK